MPIEPEPKPGQPEDETELREKRDPDRKEDQERHDEVEPLEEEPLT